MRIIIVIILIFYLILKKKKSTVMDKVYNNALALIGETEIVGASHNPKIVAMAQIFGISDDDTAWCSSFVAHCVKSAGLPLENVNASARSWLTWGLPTTTPKRGDIVVFWRTSPNSWQGHVAIFDSFVGNRISYIGGNQGSTGSVTLVKSSTSQLLGYRTVKTGLK
jgi:uncharacterized protein (TIGR02594 family)